MYTIKQLADLANVSRRTLRYYDQIDLLKPTAVADNGYRYYNQETVLRLQQIRFYQELDFSLEQIRTILDRSDFNALQSLQTQKAALQQQAERLNQLIETIDNTILHLEGKIEMDNKDLFAGFDEAKQKEYAKEAERRWDPKLVRESNQRWSRLSKDEQKAIMQEGNQIYLDMVKQLGNLPDSEDVQAIVARWHQHTRHFYEPSFATLRGLGQGYANDPAFRAKFEAMHPDLPDFLQAAITVYCDNNS
ncbi:MerR family transcriptional regulator [Candidatus Leptofilum sp.]|uniref:MerR family transcriptional regulator n=1 Tax=Candidatus Leptofilum sp. TaxID=3241576 RepID=UPI003B5A9D89